MTNILREYGSSFLKSGTICSAGRLWRKENSFVGSSDLFSIWRPLIKNLEWSEMGSQVQNRLNIAEQEITLTKSFIEIDFFFNLFFWINLKYIFRYFRLAAPYQEPWTKSCVNLFWFVFWGFIVEWIQYLTYLSSYLRQDLIRNLWWFILPLHLQFHKCAILKYMSTQTRFLWNMWLV